MDDDAALANILRKIIHDLNWLDYRRGFLVLDGLVELSEDEWATMKKVWEDDYQ